MKIITSVSYENQELLPGDTFIIKDDLTGEELSVNRIKKGIHVHFTATYRITNKKGIAKNKTKIHTIFGTKKDFLEFKRKATYIQQLTRDQVVNLVNTTSIEYL